MKKTVIISIMFILAHYAIAFIFDLQLDSMLPEVGLFMVNLSVTIGTLSLVLWCWLSYWLYDTNVTMLKHTGYMCVPSIILLLLYIPLVRVLMVNIAWVYIAPLFTFAIRYFPFCDGNATSVAISSSIMLILLALLGAYLKKHKVNTENAE